MLILQALNLAISLVTLLFAVHLWKGLNSLFQPKELPEREAQTKPVSDAPMPEGFSRGPEFWAKATAMLNNPSDAARLANDALQSALELLVKCQQAKEVDQLVDHLLVLQRNLNDFKLVRAHAVATWQGEEFREVSALYQRAEDNIQAMFTSLASLKA